MRACAAVSIVAVALAAVSPTAAAELKAANLSGYDVLGRLGRAVTLKVKLERKGLLGIHPDVEGESLDYYLVEQDGSELASPTFLGTDETNASGVAELEWKPDAPGQYLVEARVRRGSEYSAVPAQLLVATPAADRGIVLVQLDGAVTEATNLQMFRGAENEKIAAVEGAAEMLGMLSRYYQLVYLTDLEQAFTGKFKEWMRLRDIPRAPVIFWELFERSLSHKTYMNQLVLRLRKDFPQATLGIGSAQEDGEAYVANGMTAIVLTQKPGELPATIVPAAEWREIAAHVARVHQVNKLLRELAGPDPAQQQAALAQLSRLGRVGIGYVHRYRSLGDPNLASAASLVGGKLRALEAFADSLDRSSANATLTSLIAAWRFGEPAALASLYRDRETGIAAPIPDVISVELVTRNEPEPGKVVFKLRLIPAEGEPTVREVVLVREDDKTWRVDGSGS